MYSRTNAAVPADALQRLSKMTRARGTEWALGIELRSLALLRQVKTPSVCSASRS